MAQYYNLKVKQVVQETPDAVTLVFEQPETKLRYKSGQFLTLILSINGEKIRRSYSLCSCASADNYPAVTIKKVPNGKVSGYVTEQMKEGAMVEVMEPLGTFTFEPDYNKKRNIVLIAAGSGITPVFSILKEVLYQEPLSSVFLIYGNRKESAVIFKEALGKLERENEDRFKFVSVLSQPENANYVPKGRLNRSFIIKLLEDFNIPLEEAEYFICGPRGMMEEAEDALNLLRVPACQVYKESFASTPPEKVHGAVVEENQDGPKEVTVIYQGSEYKFPVPTDKSILETALDLDIDLPYSCQSGMCTACMGKCVSGKVHLDDPDGLSDKEIEEGYVLTCVGHPVSNDVVIEID